VRVSDGPCVLPETLTRYLAKYLTHFHQTYVNNALWDRDELVTVWDQRSRSRYSNICWNRHHTGVGIQYSTSCVKLDFLVLFCGPLMTTVCCAGAMQANAYNVALLNGGMGDGSQLLQVDQSGVMYNNLVPLGNLILLALQ